MSESPIYDNVNNPPPQEEFKPDVSKKARTIAYWAVAVSAAVGGAVTGLAYVWLPDMIAGNVAASVVSINTAIGLIGGGFGIIYRPTKHAS